MDDAGDSQEKPWQGYGTSGRARLRSTGPRARDYGDALAYCSSFGRVSSVDPVFVEPRRLTSPHVDPGSPIEPEDDAPFPVRADVTDETLERDAAERRVLYNAEARQRDDEERRRINEYAERVILRDRAQKAMHKAYNEAYGVALSQKWSSDEAHAIASRAANQAWDDVMRGAK